MQKFSVFVIISGFQPNHYVVPCYVMTSLPINFHFIVESDETDLGKKINIGIDNLCDKLKKENPEETYRPIALTHIKL